MRKPQVPFAVLEARMRLIAARCIAQRVRYSVVLRHPLGDIWRSSEYEPQMNQNPRLTSANATQGARVAAFSEFSGLGSSPVPPAGTYRATSSAPQASEALLRNDITPANTFGRDRPQLSTLSETSAHTPVLLEHRQPSSSLPSRHVLEFGVQAGTICETDSVVTELSAFGMQAIAMGCVAMRMRTCDCCWRIKSSSGRRSLCWF